MIEPDYLIGFGESIQQKMQEWHVPGCAVLLVRGDETVLAAGYGWRDVANKLPVNSDTVFGIASNTKAFTATALALLVERGLLEWDAPVRNYLPEFRLQDEAVARKISARDLVSHRTGLPRHDALWYKSPLPRAEIFARLEHLALSYDLRARYQYNNLMFMVAGVLIDRISGQTWEDFVEQELLIPLGMGRSSTHIEKLRSDSNSAHPYAVREGTITEIPYCDLDAAGPCGSINSTVSDLAKWLQFHLHGGVTASGKRLIQPGSLAETYRPQVVIPLSASTLSEFPQFGEGAYGLGWHARTYRNHRLIMHTGGIDGYSSLVSWMPDDQLGVALLSNLDETDFRFPPVFELYDRALGLDLIPWSEVYQARKAINLKAEQHGKERLEKQRKVDAPPSHPLAAYVGSYSHPAYGNFECQVEGDHLTISYNEWHIPLTHRHFDVFLAEDPERDSRMLVQFLMDEDGFLSGFNAQMEPAVAAQFFERVDEPLNEQVLKGLSGRYLPEDVRLKVELPDGRKYSIPARIHFMDVIYRPDGSLGLQISGDPQRNLKRVHGLQYRVLGAPSERVEFILDDGAPPKLVFVQEFSATPAVRTEESLDQ